MRRSSSDRRSLRLLRRNIRFQVLLLMLPPLVGATVATILMASLGACAAGGESASREPACQRQGVDRLTPPASGTISVAFVLSPGAEVVDFAGPWGVFEYAHVPALDQSPFKLYTVAETTEPLACSGGLVVVPDYTFKDAPVPDIVVVPAMEEPSQALLSWVRDTSRTTDVTMSVCNGAFVLAEAGILAGKAATSHHGAYAYFAATYPDVTVKRGARFVDSGNISTAGGLTSGIDLALHVIDRYYGRDAAEQTARHMEYQGTGWKDPASNAAFAKRPVSTDAHPVCPVCEMEISKSEALTESVKGRRVYFCSDGCRAIFNAHPETFTTP